MTSLTKAYWCTSWCIIFRSKITFNLHAGAAMKHRPMSYKFSGCVLKALRIHMIYCTLQKRLSRA